MDEFADDPQRWTVHVLGPDDVHSFDTAEDASAFLAKALVEMAAMFPRTSEYAPMLRFVISPPTAVSAEASRG